VSKKLADLVKQNPNSDFFLDEIPIGGVEVSPKSLKALAEGINENKHFWIACVSDKNFNKQDKNLSGLNKETF
jgi:hypothetical protein